MEVELLPFNYQLVFSSRRKTIALQVKAGQIVVRAPQGVKQAYIEQLLNTKKDWLLAKLELTKSKQALTVDIGPDLENIWYLGQYIPVCFYYDSAFNGIEHQPKQLSIYLTTSSLTVDSQTLAQQIKTILAQWFLQQAEHYLPDKINFWCQHTQLSPLSYKIRAYKSRWGSCNSRKQLSFNSQLMMLPEFVIDYVVVHELCHLVHLNHSKAFWQLVGQMLPEYQQAKAWLKQYQQQLYPNYL